MTNAKFTTTWRPRAELPEALQQIVAVRLLPTLAVRRGVVVVPGNKIGRTPLIYCDDDSCYYRWSQFDYWTPAAEFPPF